MIDYQPPEDRGLEIIHQDEHLLVVNKPAGLLSVPGKGEALRDCMISRVQQQYPSALIVHRLDMATSGLLVMALNKQMHRELSILFQSRQVEKSYTAIVDGILEEHAGVVDLPLITDWPNRPRQKVDYQQGKASETRYQLIQQLADNARIELTPVTGRSHQLRVHMMSIGHAILGDRLYASETVADKSPRLLLHAHQLGFTHPATAAAMDFRCPAPF